jgi:hypothetical protein
MSQILVLLLFLLFFPLTAWAYFDPGFGGYLVNSVISLVITGTAFVSAAVIYFFRTIVRQRAIDLWQKHRTVCTLILLSLLCAGSGCLGRFLYSRFFDSVSSLITWLFFDPELSKYTVRFIISAMAVFIILCAVIYYFRSLIGKKMRLISLLFLLVCTYAYLGISVLLIYENPVKPNEVTETKIIDPERMFKGYSLYDGKLIDERGRTVKKWSRELLGTIDENGDYYGASHGIGFQGDSWGRYTWDDAPVWEKTMDVHHEIYLSPKGTVFTFTKELHEYNHYRVAFDVILEYDKTGQALQRYPLWDHLKEFQPYHPKFAIDVSNPLIIFFTKLLTSKFYGHYDYFHINSFSMLPPNPLEGRNPAFRRGNWLISIFHGSMVFILDQDTKKILWHAVNREIEGGLEGQHSASMLPDGSILLFENGVDRKASRILIIDPLTLKIKWQYKAKKFFSVLEGFVQYLPNGNFLITESMKRRIFELTPDKRIVWEHRLTNPVSDKVGSVSFYPDEIYRATRYPQDMIDYFLLVTHELPSSGQTSATP